MDKQQLARLVQQRIDNKTKPLGSLGVLEDLARKIALIQETEEPQLTKPTLLVFAADHGLAAEGVSAYPSEVTQQMVLNFLAGGAAVNVFSTLAGLDLKVVDAGVRGDFAPDSRLLDRKVAMGSANMMREPAMTEAQLNLCFEHGEAIIEDLAQQGCTLVGFGEMGIGNTSSASLLMSLICDLPLEQCVGRGTGLDLDQLAHKRAVLERVLERWGRPAEPVAMLRYYGGLELAMMCGAMLEAARRPMVLMIDGFISTAALLAAHALEPRVVDRCVFAHCSEETGHGRMLEYLGGKPLLNMGMRLGEGSGVALAYPLVQAAVDFLNKMASFDQAGVSKRNA